MQRSATRNACRSGIDLFALPCQAGMGGHMSRHGGSGVIRLFNHYFHAWTLRKIFFDFLLSDRKSVV